MGVHSRKTASGFSTFENVVRRGDFQQSQLGRVGARAPEQIRSSYRRRGGGQRIYFFFPSTYTIPSYVHKTFSFSFLKFAI